MHQIWTYRKLTDLSRKQLEAIIVGGISPDIEGLLNWEFRGWNITPMARMLGIQKFKKGFYRELNAHRDDQCSGYNVEVRQNTLDEPHIAVPNEQFPHRYAHYLVTPVEQNSRDNLYPNALLLDYSRGPENPFWHPANRLRDYLVQIDRGNPDLLLGKAYIAIHSLRIFSNFFILERYNSSK
jgi:hypothetical protein